MKEWSFCFVSVNLSHSQHSNLYELLEFKFSSRLLWQEASPALVCVSVTWCVTSSACGQQVTKLHK